MLRNAPSRARRGRSETGRRRPSPRDAGSEPAERGSAEQAGRSEGIVERSRSIFRSTTEAKRARSAKRSRRRGQTAPSFEKRRVRGVRCHAPRRPTARRTGDVAGGVGPCDRADLRVGSNPVAPTTYLRTRRRSRRVLFVGPLRDWIRASDRAGRSVVLRNAPSRARRGRSETGRRRPSPRDAGSEPAERGSAEQAGRSEGIVERSRSIFRSTTEAKRARSAKRSRRRGQTAPSFEKRRVRGVRCHAPRRPTARRTGDVAGGVGPCDRADLRVGSKRGAPTAHRRNSGRRPEGLAVGTEPIGYGGRRRSR